jgi:hypothetical protein
LLFNGAGFSADSGLKTYNEIAKVPVYKELGLDYRGIYFKFPC